MTKKNTLSSEQEMAVEPTENVWVQANAGTGKTSVLTERLLRILFRSGDTPGGILCLTYTNAAAGEMRNRILAAFQDWAMARDDELCEMLVGVAINKSPTDEDIAHARQIFFKYIDNPDILKIKTIHGFCEEVLHRFPTEAGISPSWSLVSDAPQRVLLREALEKVVNSNLNDSKIAAAFFHITSVVSEYKLDDLLGYVEQQYKNFFAVADFDNYRKYFIDTIQKNLNLEKQTNTDKPVQELKNIIEFAKNEKRAGKTLQKLIELTTQYIENTIDFETYKSAYLTNSGTIIKNGLNYDWLEKEKQRAFLINSYNTNKQIFDDTVALFDFAAEFARAYKQIKRQHNVLDFEDLILYTHRLFSNPENMGWVLSQMDVSLSHILVDEAQDTGPLQWEILQMLTGDFFTDGDKNDMPRSIFVVGDTKQSIYGFQGTDPNAFARSREEIAKNIQNNVRQIREVPLTQSFRSTEPILKTVDMFFDDSRVKSLTSFINNPHKCFRLDAPGNVEIYELTTPGDNETAVARKEYIRNIANKIEFLISNKKYNPHDIMILVQQRNPMANPMTTELKKRNIPVAGSDRVILPNFPVIRDLMNLVRFCIKTDDDFSLCCVLKSPMFGLNEKAIYDICTTRKKNNQTVYECIKTIYPDIYNILTDFISVCAASGPYGFFTHVLDNYNMREKMVSALGNQILDPLEEFITICLAYERTQPGGLKRFIKWFITGGAEIKRDMDSGDGVRIVTVHGSKGLQAKCVFLIDTVSMPKSSNFYTVPNCRWPVWIWTPHSPDGFSPEFDALRKIQVQKNIEESFRLLYVAMTRACDELYIYGFTPNKNAPDLSWHSMLWNVLSNKVSKKDNVLRISNYDQ